jgi:hypothetical protein
MERNLLDIVRRIDHAPGTFAIVGRCANYRLGKGRQKNRQYY